NVLVAAAFASGRSERTCHEHCVAMLDLTGLLPKANLAAGSFTLLPRKQLELAPALAPDHKAALPHQIAASLSASESDELIATIRDVHASGVSIIWIEHVVHALLAVVTRLVVINFGRELAQGEPHAVMAYPVVQEIYLGIEAA